MMDWGMTLSVLTALGGVGIFLVGMLLPTGGLKGLAGERGPGTLPPPGRRIERPFVCVGCKGPGRVHRSTQQQGR